MAEADEDAIVTYQLRFALVISFLELAERYTHRANQNLCS